MSSLSNCFRQHSTETIEDDGSFASINYNHYFSSLIKIYHHKYTDRNRPNRLQYQWTISPPLLTRIHYRTSKQSYHTSSFCHDKNKGLYEENGGNDTRKSLDSMTSFCDNKKNSIFDTRKLLRDSSTSVECMDALLS